MESRNLECSLFMMNLDEHTRKSIYKALVHQSKITPDIETMPGMSSPKVRHMLNNLCNFSECRYLEIGLWVGSTFISAVFLNPGTHWGVDNWSEFRGGQEPRDYFFHNLGALAGQSKANIIDSDFKTLDFQSRGISGINVFFYDGGHTEEDQYDALVKCLPAMADEFIFVVDDWNEDPVRKGTDRAIKDLGLHAVYHQILPALTKQDVELWWNGVGIYVFKKTLPAKAVECEVVL